MNTAFKLLIPTPANIQNFLNAQTGGNLSYLITSLLGSPASARAPVLVPIPAYPSRLHATAALHHCVAAHNIARCCRHMGVVAPGMSLQGAWQQCADSQKVWDPRRNTLLFCGACARAAVVNGVRSCGPGCVDLAQYAFMKSDLCLCNSPLLTQLAGQAVAARAHLLHAIVGASPAVWARGRSCGWAQILGPSNNCERRLARSTQKGFLRAHSSGASGRSRNAAQFRAPFPYAQCGWGIVQAGGVGAVWDSWEGEGQRS